MKKLILVTLLGLTSFCTITAQDVFNQVVKNAKTVLDDPKADDFMISVSQFKYTALQYLCNTAMKLNGGSVEGNFLDIQAYSLNHFIISYFSELAKAQNASNSTQKDIMKKYWRASTENPLFEDQDKETTDVFMDDPDCITPFSLNTDWEKADNAITEK